MKLFMKGILRYSILLIAPLLFACRGPEARENKNTVPVTATSMSQAVDEKYILDKKESLITWKGYMLFESSNAHVGYAYVSDGELLVGKGRVTGGRVEVDMNSIADKVHGSDNDLINHLKSADFFDVEKFPSSAFIITRVGSPKDGNVDITGNLTIKGITNMVTFPAKVEVNGATVSATGKLVIDRTKWDVRYGSGKFFENLANETISDDIEFDMKIVARKK